MRDIYGFIILEKVLLLLLDQACLLVLVVLLFVTNVVCLLMLFELKLNSLYLRLVKVPVKLIVHMLRKGSWFNVEKIDVIFY